ncbi:DNA adenine methylase [Uliginosibacterium sp. H1]|uniref:DNA adenine methylase n=1 Tax=Uliginosibacterium sp. H1 TaxID=3114757 RepID=UPI002E186AA0|nr:Dam family site-specific DNA-(adenine-N6)-methyltransferase [Uliginosibacterium sp. H1]
MAIDTFDRDRHVELETKSESLAHYDSPTHNSLHHTEHKETLPLKWAGGKRHILPHLTKFFLQGHLRYFEPFLGGGAAYFAFCPHKPFISDSNAELVNTYEAIRSDPAGVHRLYQRHRRQHSKEYYYSVRASQPRSSHGTAARMIYLNQACFNGLYRVNQRGEFNVPIGSKRPTDFSLHQFTSWAHKLRGAQIRPLDFEESISRSKPGDFIFADPPYALSSANGSFLRYNEKIFSWDDQLRLFNCLKKAVHRGVRVVATNASEPAIIELYAQIFDVREVRTKSYIAADSRHRGMGKEILIHG